MLAPSRIQKTLLFSLSLLVGTACGSKSGSKDPPTQVPDTQANSGGDPNKNEGEDQGQAGDKDPKEATNPGQGTQPTEGRYLEIPDNPAYGEEYYFHKDIIAKVVVKGLPPGPVVVVQQAQETLSLSLDLVDATGMILDPTAFRIDVRTYKGTDLVIPVTRGDPKLLVVGITILDPAGRALLANLRFHLIETSPEKAPLANLVAELDSSFQLTPTAIKDLLARATEQGEAWLQVYDDAFRFYKDKDLSDSTADRFASDAAGQPSASLWLERYKDAYMFYRGHEQSHSSSEQFAEKALLQSDPNAWLEIYKSAYNFYKSHTQAHSQARQFAEEAAAQAEPKAWLDIYKDAYDFLVSQGASHSQAKDLAEVASEKRPASIWLQTFKDVYRAQINSGETHSKAKRLGEEAADLAIRV